MSGKGAEKSHPLWVVFGKLAAILSVVGTLVALYSQLWPSGARLVVTCKISQFSMPLQVFVALPPDQKAASVSGFLRCGVANEGDRQARGVALALPDDNAAFERQVDGHIQPPNGRPLDLGDFRPGESKEAVAWVPYGGLSVRDLRLTHLDGHGSVALSMDVYGWNDWFRWPTLKSFSMSIGLLLAFFVPLQVLIFLLREARTDLRASLEKEQALRATLQRYRRDEGTSRN